MGGQGGYMKAVKSFSELQRMILENKCLLVYLSSPGCSVCYADMPKVEKLAEEMRFPSVHIDISEVPEASGQLIVFAAPAVLLFYRNKEYHREVRIIDFSVLKKRMMELPD